MAKTPGLIAPMKSADVKGDLSLVRVPCLYSPKFDGFRASVQECPDESRGGYYPMVLSSNLKPIPNEFVQGLLGIEACNGFDGELVVGDPTDKPFKRTSSGVTSRSGEPDFKFYVFDYLRALHLPYEDRLHILSKLVKKLPKRLQGRVVLVAHERALTHEDLRVEEERAVACGYEGLMTRDPQGPHKEGYPTIKENWLCKVKRRPDAECRVLGCYEQTENTNAPTKNALGKTQRSSHKAGKVGKGTLGGFEVEGVNGPYAGKVWTMGTGNGLTDAERARLWDIWLRTPKKLIGTLRKYSYDPGGGPDAPRQPIDEGARDPSDMAKVQR